MKLILATLTLVYIAAATDTPPVDPIKPDVPRSAVQLRNMMLGHWFGDSPTKDGGRRMQIVERRRDGTMTIRFRVIDPAGEVHEQTQVEFWGISGPIYFTIMRGWLKGMRFDPADPTQPYYYDAYEIIELTDKTFRYRHVTTGNKFRIDRVAPDFDFPE